MVAPPTMAVNCWLCKAANVAEGGVREMLTVGLSVTVALADLLESATLVAVTVTVWELVIEAGAVYRPAAVLSFTRPRRIACAAPALSAG